MRLSLAGNEVHIMKSIISRNLKKITACFAAFVISVLCFNNVLTIRASEQEQQTLKVAFPITKSISEIDENGNYTGRLVDCLNEISEYTGWNYEYITGDPEILLNDFLQGKYDLMGGMFYSEALEEYFAYPEYSMGISSALLVCNTDNTSIIDNDLTTLNGKTIGVYEKADEKIKLLESFLKTNSINCTLKKYSYDELASASLYEYLENKEIDLILANDSEVIEDDFRIAASFPAQPYYLVTHSGSNQILNKLNWALKEIYEANSEQAK